MFVPAPPPPRPECWLSHAAGTAQTASTAERSSQQNSHLKLKRKKDLAEHVGMCVNAEDLVLRKRCVLRVTVVLACEV